MTIATSSPDDSDGLSAVLGGDAIALGEDTLTVGSVSAEMVDGGSATTLSGTVDMLAAAETADGATAQTLADTFADIRSEEHTSELQSLMRISYAVFCLK